MWYDCQPYAPAVITPQEIFLVLISVRLKKFTLPEVRSAIKQLRSKKAPERDLITGEVVQVLPDIGIRVITQIFNSVLRNWYFPGQWKVSQIITVLMPE